MSKHHSVSNAKHYCLVFPCDCKISREGIVQKTQHRFEALNYLRQRTSFPRTWLRF